MILNKIIGSYSLHTSKKAMKEHTFYCKKFLVIIESNKYKEEKSSIVMFWQRARLGESGQGGPV